MINTIASPTFVYRFIFDLYYACIRYILFNRIIVIINLESLIPQVDDTLLATSMMLSFFRDCSILKLSRLISSSIIGNYIGEYVVHITLLQLRCLNLFVPLLLVSSEQSTTTVCFFQFTTFSSLLTMMRSNSFCTFFTSAITDLTTLEGCRNLIKTKHLLQHCVTTAW